MLAAGSSFDGHCWEPNHARFHLFPHWRDRLRPTSLRQTLVIGLAPGLIVVVILAIVAWCAVSVMSNANAALAETGWELATTRALQLNFQQTLIPFNNQIVARGQHNSSGSPQIGGKSMWTLAASER